MITSTAPLRIYTHLGYMMMTVVPDAASPSKGLVVLSHGNSTLERKCACIPGYHLNRDYEFCKRNIECGPGFGVHQTPGRDTDTVCKPCLPGHFSSINSSIEKCQPWTNCTELGKAQRASGTSFSDAVCEKANSTVDTAATLTEGYTLIHILVVLLLFATVASASTVVLICCRKRVKTLTVTLQRWLHEYCSQGEKDKYCSNFNNKHLENTCLQLSDGILLLTLDDKRFCEQGVCCLEGHFLSSDTGLESGHSESEEDVPLSSSTESNEDQPKHMPTEDEYVDRGHQRSFWSTAAKSQLEHQSAPPFAEPLEFGENDRFSQCFVGTECVFDSEDSHTSDHSCGADYAHPSSGSSVQVACNCMGAFQGAQGTAIGASYFNLDTCHSYDLLLRDSYSKEIEHFDIGNNISGEALEHGHNPRYVCGSDCVSANGIGEKSLRQDSSETNHPSTKRSTSHSSSTSSSSSSASPTPSAAPSQRTRQSCSSEEIDAVPEIPRMAASSRMESRVDPARPCPNLLRAQGSSNRRAQVQEVRDGQLVAPGSQLRPQLRAQLRAFFFGSEALPPLHRQDQRVRVWERAPCCLVAPRTQAVVQTPALDRPRQQLPASSIRGNSEAPPPCVTQPLCDQQN
ncbi:hypothetical protein NDU88_006369 [Pleurodeles waltl]|uniref:TNFR-Cys domain-containing protein n=1 Tax=Pleurodeles waltl TaxID=8319 RepID=A0AAV7VPF0_PLEWA|nr:hypothetical protein NDU88_006369 [Pleurodeles waltl]